MSANIILINAYASRDDHEDFPFQNSRRPIEHRAPIDATELLFRTFWKATAPEASVEATFAWLQLFVATDS